MSNVTIIERAIRSVAWPVPSAAQIFNEGQLKLQTPNTKHQRSSKLQVPSSKRGPGFGAWNLGFLWCLELGFWCFDAGISLEFGVWDLEFRRRRHDSTRPNPVLRSRLRAVFRLSSAAFNPNP